jgi:hypothetical protein
MNDEDIKLLEANGWEVECESPQEIRLKEDPETFASGSAVDCILMSLREYDKIDETVDEIQELLRVLSMDERMEVLNKVRGRYCFYCGITQREGRPCQCMNDE